MTTNNNFKMKNFKKLAFLAMITLMVACSKPKPQEAERSIASDSVWIKEQLHQFFAGKHRPCGDSIHGYLFGLKSLDGQDSLWIEGEY
jgi:hypothetical protein